MDLTDAATLGKELRAWRSALEPVHGPAEAMAMAREAFHALLGTDPLLKDQTEPLDPAHARTAAQWLERAQSGEPLQYITGQVLFHHLKIAVDPRVLIPRPETEEMVQRIIGQRTVPPRRIVDLCTGSGCIALALKQAFPQARVQATDISAEALEVARVNARSNGLDVEWLRHDLLHDPASSIFGNEPTPGATLLVSNPPYVPRADMASMARHVTAHEPHAALFVDDLQPQVFYLALASLAMRMCLPGDELWAEVHHLHAAASADVMRAAGFRQVEILTDLSGNPRFIHARW
jgi:release factor glutamine methyltransferase